MVWVLVGLVLVCRITTAPGMAQGDDLAYAELAWRYSEGMFGHAFTLFYFRWLVFVPTAVLFRSFGVGNATALLWPILLSVLNVWLVVRIVTRESTPRAGWLAGLLYACFPLIALYGTFLEPATPLEGATLLAFFALQRSRDNGSRGWFVIAGLAGGATMLARETGGFVFVLLGAWLWREHGLSRRTVGRFLVLALLGAIPLLVQAALVKHWTGDAFLRLAISREAVEIQNRTVGMDPKDLWFYFQTLVTTGGFCDRTYFGWYGFLFLPLLLLGLAWRRRETLLFMGWAVAYLCFLSFAPSSWNPYRTLIRNIRYLAVIAWPLCATAGTVIDAAWAHSRAWWRVGGLLLFLALLTSSVQQSWHLTNAFFHGHSPFRQIARFVLSQPGPVFYADFDLPLLYKFYGGYRAERLHPVSDLAHLTGSGTLALPVGHHPDRYLLPYPLLLSLARNPPPGWQKLAVIGDSTIFSVVPVGREEQVARREGLIDLGLGLPVDLTPWHVRPDPGVEAVRQPMAGFPDLWAGNDQVFVGLGGPGQAVRLRFRTAALAAGRLSLTLTTGPDFGQFSARLDGRPLGGLIESFAPQVGRRETSFPLDSLPAGSHLLEVECVGKDPSSAGFRLGLDTVAFLPLP